jgi:conjugal transfer pilus assembly protein TraF
VKKAVLLIVVLLLFSFTVRAVEKEEPPLPPEKKDEGYYRDRKRGWYWYEIEKKKEEEKKKPEEELASVSLKNYTIDEVWNMHPDRFSKLLDDLKKKAVMMPTEESVLEYYIIQDIARRKSLAFASTAGFVLQKNPELAGDELSNSGPARDTRTAMNVAELMAVLESYRNDYGIVFFSSRQCGYCLAQKRILSSFVERYGWSVEEVDIDEKPSYAAVFGVERVPYLILVSRETGKYIPLAQGVVGLSELEERVQRGVLFLQGQRSAERFVIRDYESGGFLETEKESVKKMYERFFKDYRK